MLDAVLPFTRTKKIWWYSCRRGGDLQQLHERLRVHARASSEKRAHDGEPADLLARIAGDSAFGLTPEETARAASPQRLIGRAAEQVEIFVREELDPALEGIAETEAAAVR